MPTPINISASRGASILGLSAWKTPVQTWLEIMEAREPGFCAVHNYELPVFEYNAAMRWGHCFESAIIELAEELKDGADICNREKLFTDPEHPFLTCHIDGDYDYNDPEIAIIHEGKTSSAYFFNEHFGEDHSDNVPIDYQIQSQHILLVTKYQQAKIHVLCFPKRPDEFEETGLVPYQKENGEWKIKLDDYNDIDPIEWALVLGQMGYFHEYIIKPNPELQQLMLNHYTEFWHKNIIGKLPPEPQCYDDIRRLVRDPIGTIICNDEIERLMSEYKNIGEEISGTGPLAKRRDQIKMQVLDWMTGQGVTVDDDSVDKYILRDNTGRKIASYGKNKNGVMVFR